MNNSTQEIVLEKKQSQIRDKVKVKSLIQKHGMSLVLLLMIILMTILSPAFLTTRNIMNVIRQISVISIIGFGVTMVIITTGIDLSSGSVLALAGVVATSFAHPGQYPIIIPIIMGLLVGAIAGSINGTFVAFGELPAFIPTLGMMIAARGFALIYSNGRPITNLSQMYEFIGGGYLFGVPFPIYVMFFTAVISHILLKHTKFGRYIYAIGGNAQAAIVSGINVKKYLVLVYTYAGLLAGLAGIVLSSRLSAGQPTAGVNYELDAIAAAVIGGTSLSGGIGTITGTIVGALIMGVLNNGLDLLQVSAYWQQVLKGAIIIGAVLLDKKKKK
ncbi:ribose ABC transporter permease [Caloramator sp. CAR-1]|uniref:ABC transporter permease n=1 Tax=Caloramator sp. CAR-1 TaxID=3062777 RepID=UPI0026E4253C|nr:ribose ABC transporter permease [Caloramator sp. CAR-1]MDO6355654.1 ribose ABC transporter permease [Caloramator sp. CAR-1]